MQSDLLGYYDGITGLIGTGLAVALVFALLLIAGLRGEVTPSALQKRLGLGMVLPALFVIALLLWVTIAGVLFAGLFWLIVKVLLHAAPGSAQVWDFRFMLAQIAALTTVLGAVIALPVTLNRLRLTQEQTGTASAALFNQKITEAAADLHAQRQITVEGKDIWQDDITRRNAAIDRLEGLVREQPSEAARVSRLLSVYVRELSHEHPAEETPETNDVSALKTWAQALRPCRPDIENAAQVLGGLANIKGVEPDSLKIDLRHANLQGFDLEGLNFPPSAQFKFAKMQGAKLWYTQLQGADLFGAQLQGAGLWDAQLQGANLGYAQLPGAQLGHAQLQKANLGHSQLRGAYLHDAKLQRANLGYAQLHGAKLWRAQLQGASLWGVEIDSSTSLGLGSFWGAGLSKVDHTVASQLRAFWPEIFADGSVQLAEGDTRPAHWVDKVLDPDDFEAAWRAWQAEIGFDADDPATWEDPQ